MMPNRVRSDAHPAGNRSLRMSSFRWITAKEPQQRPLSTVSAAGSVRKTTLWQWLTRGEADGANAAEGAAPAAESVDADQGKDGRSRESGAKHRLSESSSEAAADARVRVGGGSQARPPPTPRPTAPLTPLYDEVELSGLTSQMADFVQRLQRKESGQLSSERGGGHSSVSAVEAVTIRRSISTCVGLGFGYGVVGPISAVQRLVRRILTAPLHTMKTRDAADPQETEPAPEGEAPDLSGIRHHYHHYIHHHHYHYHYEGGNASSGSEDVGPNPRPRRLSESSCMHGRIPSLAYNEISEDGEDEQDQSPLGAFLARRRRHSDSAFVERYRSAQPSCNGVGGDAGRGPARAPAEHEGRRRILRSYTSERIPMKAKGEEMLQDGGADEEAWKGGDGKSRRRRSMESVRYSLGGQQVVATRRHSASMAESWQPGEGQAQADDKAGAASPTPVELPTAKQLAYSLSVARQVSK